MEVILSKEATKEYNCLPKSEQAKILKKLSALRTDPSLGKKLAGELRGIRSLKAWSYRILYEINEKVKRIEILKIAHRQGVYK